MNTKKEEAMKEILNDFSNVANLILSQLDLLEKVIISEDIGTSHLDLEEIKSNEKRIDSYEVMISEKIINSIVLYQPLASDLRKLIASYRMTLNLERIGDMIINIANAIKKIKDPDIFEDMSELISNMLMSSVIMVRKSLLSYLNNDRDLAIWTIGNDSVVDEMHHKLIKKAISNSKLSKENQHILRSFISINSILSNIERIADHATNIAEASIYSLEGKDVRHEGHIMYIPDVNKDEQGGDNKTIET